MRKFTFFIIAVLMGVVLFVKLDFGDEKNLKSAAKKDMTKAEILMEIKKTLGSEKEILDYIPQLKKITQPDGKEFYTYEGVRLEDLAKERLEKILARVRTEAVKLRTDRINRQLEAIRNIQRLQTNIPKTPQYTPPQVPQPPRIPQTPKVPKMPSRTNQE